MPAGLSYEEGYITGELECFLDGIRNEDRSQFSSYLEASLNDLILTSSIPFLSTQPDS